MKKAITLFAAMIVGAVLASGCSTVEGLSKDMQKAGEAISNVGKKDEKKDEKKEEKR